MAKTAPARGSAAPRIAHFPEPVARLASVRMSLRLVEPFGSGPASDMDDARIAAAFEDAPPADRALFERRSGRLVAVASEGVEALMAGFAAGREPSAEASQELADRSRRELAEISGLVLP